MFSFIFWIILGIFHTTFFSPLSAHNGKHPHFCENEATTEIFRFFSEPSQHNADFISLSDFLELGSNFFQATFLILIN